ncbi:hypothetical protein ACFLS1_12485 [Verrucomicrobiota bacterium]
MKKTIHIIVLMFVTVLASFGVEDPDTTSLESTPVHEHGREWFPMGGIKYDSVTGLTGAGCILFHIDNPFAQPNEDGLYMCSHSFLILQVEAGEGGGKLQFGIGEWYMAGWVAKLSLLRTWSDSMELEPDQTYLGAEVQLNFFQLNGAVGVYTELDGDGEDETLVTWSAGIGF